MQYQLHTKSIENVTYVDSLIKKEVLPKLLKYSLQFDDFEPLMTVHLKRDSRWGFESSADLLLPKNYRIHAEARDSTMKQTLIDLRKKLRAQLADYKHDVTTSD